MADLRYIQFDPDEIWLRMMQAYEEAGGIVPAAGDEKEILLRGVQAFAVQQAAQVDMALKMQTVRWAVGEYLDVIGESRGCPRMYSAKATAKIRLHFTGEQDAITIVPQNYKFSKDGLTMYSFTATEPWTIPYGQTVTVPYEIIADDPGTQGNALVRGDTVHITPELEGLTSITVSEDAKGGQDDEDDENYRERIYQKAITSVTTGPAEQYESAARSYSSDIVDAKAYQQSAGNVMVRLLLKAGVADTSAIIDGVEALLNAKDTRPLTDHVVVALATAKEYRLELQYSTDGTVNISEKIAEAIKEYQTWQESKVGLPFNPDRLMALAYQAGATYVQWGTGSHYDHEDVGYVVISDDYYSKGVITTEVVQP